MVAKQICMLLFYYINMPICLATISSLQLCKCIYLLCLPTNNCVPIFFSLPIILPIILNNFLELFYFI